MGWDWEVELGAMTALSDAAAAAAGSPFRLAAAQAFIAGPIDGQVFTAGASAAQSYLAGAVEGQANAQ